MFKTRANKRRVKKNPSKVKQLQDRALELWKKVCIQRDGIGCQVAKHYPELRFSHTNQYQVDHCITRANKQYFTDPKNGTVVCSACNRAKHFQQKSINRLIDEIVKAREGEHWLMQAVSNDMSKSPFTDWSNVEWLEAQCEMLQDMIGGKSE